MEEILASIRRIISEDDAEENAAGEAEQPEAAEAPPVEEAVEAPPVEAEAPEEPDQGAEILELTEMVADDGDVVSLRDEDPEPVLELQQEAEPEPEPEPAPPEPEPEPEIAAMPEPDPVDETDIELTDVEPDDSLLSDAPAAAASASLASLVSAVSAQTTVGRRDLTIEQLIKDLLRPMLKEWLDQQLPDLVEGIVREEIERVVASTRNR